ncbi:aspartyl/asparaginyl beta-hydroxylase domain-containing protein [Xanthomonas sacchari]|uniref:aspartyl/asparaginyl beta-hydroxylase domain-containing protein n=1 Tax=Xanthomonas sacchari TaxID=56458 RepID=UPI003529B725
MAQVSAAAEALEAVQRHVADGDYRAADALCERALDAAPADLALRRAHAMLLMDSGAFARAAHAWALVAAAAPSVEAWSRSAICLARLGEHAQALPAFEHALQLAADAFLVRLWYAESLDALGRHDDALPMYFAAVRTAQAKGRWLDQDTTAPELRARVVAAMRRIDQGRHAVFVAAIQPLLDRFGEAALRRVMAALRIYLGLQPRPADDGQHPTFLYIPELDPSPYLGAARFPWYDHLQDAAAGIVEEAHQVLASRQSVQPFLDFSNGASPQDYLVGQRGDGAWDAYFFFRHGQAYPENLQRCPRTAAALAQVPLTRIEGHAPEVLFSILAPGTTIKPHYGVTNARVVTHLPLIVPPDCALEVAGIAHAWEVGRLVTFNDTCLHQAWNHSDRVRVVTILDTWHPDLDEAETLALRQLVETIGAFNLRAGV